MGERGSVCVRIHIRDLRRARRRSGRYIAPNHPLEPTSSSLSRSVVVLLQNGWVVVSKCERHVIACAC
jgi:hypothetical protein